MNILTKSKRRAHSVVTIEIHPSKTNTFLVFILCMGHGQYCFLEIPKISINYLRSQNVSLDVAADNLSNNVLTTENNFDIMGKQLSLWIGTFR